jgi:hypothetical protein
MSTGHILSGKREWERQDGRRSRMWDGNIKIDLQEIGCTDVVWIRPTLSLGTSGGAVWNAVINVCSVKDG